MLRVVRGDPDPIELAALVGRHLSGDRRADDRGTSSRSRAWPSQWAAPERLLPPAVHPTGWWASALPR